MKVDIHLPIGLYRRCPFLYLGPDYRSLPLGVLADILEHRGERRQRLYPLTIYEEEGRRRIPLLFTLALIYVDSEDGRVTYLTQPIYLGDRRREALETLLEEALRLSRFMGCRRIDVEVHEWVKGEVSFPISPNPILSYRLDKELGGVRVDELESLGLKRLRSLFCYEMKTERVCGEAEDLEIEVSKPKEFLEIRRKLLTRLRHEAFRLSRRDTALEEAIPFFEGSTLIAYRRRWLSRRPVGYLRWIPNLHEILSPTPLLFPRILEAQRYRRGKIFDWAYGEGVELRGLLVAAAESMKGKNIESLQVSNVEESDRETQRLLESMEMRPIHKVSLLSMEVDA